MSNKIIPPFHTWVCVIFWNWIESFTSYDLLERSWTIRMVLNPPDSDSSRDVWWWSHNFRSFDLLLAIDHKSHILILFWSIFSYFSETSTSSNNSSVSRHISSVSRKIQMFQIRYQMVQVTSHFLSWHTII